MPRRTRNGKGSMGLALIAALILPRSNLPEQTGRGAGAVVAIRNVDVVPLDTERVDAHRTVILRGATIERVGLADQTAIPRGATIVDGRGKYLVPGLAEMHAHLAEPGDPPGTAEAELMLFLANGVTTIRSMRGFPNHLSLRDKVAKGELLGPSIIVAGPGLDGEAAKSPAEGESAVREQKRLGYDLIKVLPGLSVSTYDAIARTARELSIPFAGHIPSDVGLLHAFEAGQQTIEHLDGYLELLNGSKPIARERMLDVVRRTVDTGTWNCPTLSVMEANLGLIGEADLLSRPELEYVPDAFVKLWLKFRSYGNPPRAVSEIIEANRMTLLKALNDAGARILLGTDSPQLFNVPGFSIRREIRLMADAGLKPYDILRSATARVGEYTGRPCGTIKPGQCADLILLDADPLKDVQNLSRLAGVVVRGRWLPSSDLQRRLQAIRERPGNYRRQAGGDFHHDGMDSSRFRCGMMCRISRCGPCRCWHGYAGGRKRDFPDAERLVKRVVAQELTLSFVPDAEQRLWRTVMRRKYQITRSRVQLHNRLEALLEEAHIKISSVVSDLLGTSARRMLQAVGDGATDPAALAALADQRVRATPEQLCDAFGACADLHPVYRRLVKLTLDDLRTIEDHLTQLDQQMAQLLAHHHDAVQRLAEVPGLGVDSAQPIIAEVGASAAAFPSAKQLASWMGACPGNEESAGVNYSHRCPKGNRQMRRVLNQAANAAVNAKGTIFAIVYRRLVPRLGHAQAIGAIAHRLCRLIWKILHQGIRYEERGPAVSVEAKKVRTRKMIRELRTLGYHVELLPAPSSNPV